MQTPTLAKLLENMHKLAYEALELWHVPPNSKVRLINVSENITFLIEAISGYKAILRVHRAQYHSERGIECELAWLDALSKDKVINAPKYYLGKDGQAIQKVIDSASGQTRRVVLFEFIAGTTPDDSGDLTNSFKELGTLAAKCHIHSVGWEKPAPFERLVWDCETILGSNPIWGNWRDGPEVTKTVQKTLEQVESCVHKRLARYGKSKTRFNLIHADMRLSNLLVDDYGTRLIDFDDCGYGWFMYDFAAALSFMENDPQVEIYKKAWLQGYQKIRILSSEDIKEIDTFILLRRLALLAWIGSHIEAPEPQLLANGFALETAQLGKAWLERQIK